MNAEFDVVIVGGGAAGIAAARRLSQTGLSVLVLEAASRLGGRAWTERLSGFLVDLGCVWLHCADRNAWTRVAEDAGIDIDRQPPPWRTQFDNRGFAPGEQPAARRAFEEWMERVEAMPPASDCAADTLQSDGEWNTYVRTIMGFITGARLEDLSVADYLTYSGADTGINWRPLDGYGSLIVSSFPAGVALRLATPVEGIDVGAHNVALKTPVGTVLSRSAILTVSSTVLAGDVIRFPSALDPWREAASRVPLGYDEKLFFEILDARAFDPETDVMGDPRDPRSGRYHIRPLGRPVVECFMGGEGARFTVEHGSADGFAYALDQLADVYGSAIRRNLRPLIASGWTRMKFICGAYSNALPGHASARHALAQPFEGRIFFAGEATNARDYGTAHGAHDSGVRAAEQVIAALRP